MPSPNTTNGSGIDEVLNRAPDDSLETRAIKRSGWTLHVAIAVSGAIAAAVIGTVLYLQAEEAEQCEELIEDFRAEWASSQGLILGQLNDRLDSQAVDLMRCRDRNVELFGMMRALETEWREKLERMEHD